MNKRSFILTEQVELISNILVDHALNRVYKYQNYDDLNRNTEILNKEYFLNFSYNNPITFFKRYSYTSICRFDIIGEGIMEIFAEMFIKIHNFLAPVILVFIGIILVITNNFAIPALLYLFCIDICVCLSLHEALHLYFYRRFSKNTNIGILIWKKCTFSVVVPNKDLKSAHEIIIAAASGIVNFGIGIMLMISYLKFTSNQLIGVILFFFIAPWVFNITSLLPFAADGHKLFNIILKKK